MRLGPVALVLLLALQPKGAYQCSAQSLIADLREPATQCDYLIVTPAGFGATALRLAKHRADNINDGVEHPGVVCVDTVVRQFPPPGPFRAYESLWYALKNAVEGWQVPPRFVVLLGDDSLRYDFTDTVGLTYGLMPAFCESGRIYGHADSTRDTILAYSDRYYCTLGRPAPPQSGGSFTCSTSTPAIGRIPSQSAAECSVYVDKVSLYETTRRSGRLMNTVLLVADDAYQDTVRDAIDHVECAERAAQGSLRGFFVDKLYLGNYAKDSTGSHSAARQAFLAAAGSGIRWAIYFGHGHRDSLTSEGFLRGQDSPLVARDTSPFVFFSLSCDNGDFVRRGRGQSMCKRYLMEPSGGCIAYLASSNAEYASNNVLLAQSLFGLTQGATHLSLGEATYGALGELWYCRTYYGVLGDPALLFTKQPRPLAFEASRLSDGTISVLCSATDAGPSTNGFAYRISRPQTRRLADDTARTWVYDSLLVAAEGDAALPYEVQVNQELASSPFKVTFYAYGDLVEGRVDSLFQPDQILQTKLTAPLVAARIHTRVVGHRVVVEVSGPVGSIVVCMMAMDGRLVKRAVCEGDGPAQLDLSSQLCAAGTYVLRIVAGNQAVVRSLVWPGP